MNRSDILEMTVGELVEKTSLKIKLGADKGSSFVFCGSVAKFNIEQIDAGIIDSYENPLQIAQRRYQGFKAKPRSKKSFEEEVENNRKKFVKKSIKKIIPVAAEGKELEKHKKLLEEEKAELYKEAEKAFPTTPKDFELWKRDLKAKTTKALDDCKRLQRKIDKFTTIGGRQIVDIYPSIDEEDTFIVIFDGREVGKYWTTHEYETGIIETDGE